MGTCQDQQGQTGPWNERPIEDYGNEGSSLRAGPLKWNETKGIKVGGKEEVWAKGTHALPFPRNSSNQSHMNLLARKKHNAVPPHLLNADPLAQIIDTETVADVIIDDAEACALLDSGATADLMTQAYAKARNFNIRPMTELSDHFINLSLAARFKTTFPVMSNITSK